MARDHTYMDDIDIIIIGKSFQHFTDRSTDQFKGQSRHASTPGKQQLKEIVQITFVLCKRKKRHTGL